MRVKVSSKIANRLFGKIVKNGLAIEKLALRLGFSVRTIADWKGGKFTIPHTTFKALIKMAKINEEELSPRLLPDRWHIQSAARKGALRRMEFYGNLGTPEGRKRGGINSIKVHRENPGNFKVLKTFRKQRYSEELAELLGILIGDGHLSNYQVLITTNSETDFDHALFVKGLIENLFGVSVSYRVKKKEKTVNLVASSRNLVIFLNKKGMPIGNKIKNNLSIPHWIYRKHSYKKAFLRGLFDTDGSVYIDTHKSRGRTYNYLGWSITSYAGKLLRETTEVLRGLGFNPTQKDTQKSVFLRRQDEIKKYFREVGTHNPKHRRRFLGGVPKWS